MAFQLDRHNRLSYAAQVQRQTLAQLVAGRLCPGDRLPSVRQFARKLGISRTTAERIQDVLCETTLAEIRPRSGAFVLSPDMATVFRERGRVQAVYNFLKSTVLRARELGLDPLRLADLIGAFDEPARINNNAAFAPFPVIATQEAYECMHACLDHAFPAKLVHLLPNAHPSQFPRGAPYLLSGYYLRGQARTIADAVGCPLVYVRYNVTLLNRAMTIPANTHRWFVTRDADNAETTRVFLASAYPEVPTARYTVKRIVEFLEIVQAGRFHGTVWPTITAVPFLKDHVSPDRVEIMHPLLADDFVEELHCLALLR
jgi:GntR family transcriptional regulator